MTPPLTPAEIADLEAKLGAMTEGPWWNESAVIHAPIPGRTDGAACHPCSCVNSDNDWEDAEGIAALRNNAEELLRLARRGMELERIVSLAEGLLEEPGEKRHDPNDGRHHVGEIEGDYCGFCVLQGMIRDLRARELARMPETPTRPKMLSERLRDLFVTFGWDYDEPAFAERYETDAWVYNLANGMDALAKRLSVAEANLAIRDSALKELADSERRNIALREQAEASLSSLRAENENLRAFAATAYESGLRKIGVFICPEGHLTAKDQVVNNGGEPHCLTCEVSK